MLKSEARDPETDYFSLAVAPHGYRWWYADIVSDCGGVGIVIIGFIGSVFSPYYAAARRRGHGQAEQHCALNAIVYRPGRKAWAMTERTSLAALPHGVQIGPSSMRWEDDALVIQVNERCNPWPKQWRGELRITPEALQTRAYALHSNAKHWWWPVAASARAEVDLISPALEFSGNAYIDTNFGDEPLETGFSRWDWSRAERLPTSHKAPALVYRAWQRDQQIRQLALAWNAEQKTLVETEVPEAQKVAPSGWRVARPVALEQPVTTVRTLEDTPFYVRSLLHCGPQGFMHESLDLDRFASRWVQTLLPFRMPRRAFRFPD
ncbi:MAG: carotenoid 1,2-hydratase [Pseudomonadota bacterium]